MSCPRHITIIMDGNGRWAQNHGMNRVMGHKQGAKRARSIIEYCLNSPVAELTLWAMSEENRLHRPQQEVGFLFELLLDILDQEAQKWIDQGVWVRFIGHRDSLPQALVQSMNQWQSVEPKQRKLTLNIALNFSGRSHLFQSFCDYMLTITACEQPSLEAFSGFLANQFETSDPDLLIRTGGEMRLSNFMIWQLAWTELYFSDMLWPDFDVQALQDAIANYAKRQRRYGRIDTQTNAKA